MLTNEQIDTMIAEKVMAWHRNSNDPRWFDADERPVKIIKNYHPSADDGQALEALDRLCDDNNLRYTLINKYIDDKHYIRLRDLNSSSDPVAEGMHESRPMAICLAILDYLGMKDAAA